MIYIYKRSNGGLYYYDHFGVERAFEGFTLENLNLKVQDKLHPLMKHSIYVL